MSPSTIMRRIARAILGRKGIGAVDHATHAYQAVRVRGEYGEEQVAARLQPYGLASDPPADQEYLGLQVGAHPERLAVVDGIAADRPTDIVAGETRLYNQRGSKVQMLPDGTVLSTNLIGEVRINPDGSVLLTPAVGGATSVLANSAGVVVSSPLGVGTFNAAGCALSAGATTLALTAAGAAVVSPTVTVTSPLITTVAAKVTGCPLATEPLDYASKAFVEAAIAAAHS